MQDYSDLLDILIKAHIKPVVTLVTYSSYPDKKEAVTEFDHRLQKLCEEKGAVIVDLNPTLAPAGILLPQYTIDGVHFKPAGYTVWVKKLHDALPNDIPN